MGILAMGRVVQGRASIAALQPVRFVGAFPPPRGPAALGGGAGRGGGRGGGAEGGWVRQMRPMNARRSKTKVTESLVGFGHTVHFVALFHCPATAFGGFEQLVGQTLGHRLFATLAGRFLDPAHRQRQPADRTPLHRHLVVGTADTAGLDFDHGLDVVDGHGEGFQRVLVGVLFLYQFQGAIDDALGNRLLAAFHDHVHEFGQLYIAKLGIRQDFTLGDFATTWHFFTSFASVGIFADTAGIMQNPHLLDPRKTFALSGHYAATPRHAASSTEISATLTWPWAFWRRTWSAPVCGLSRLAGRASRARCGSAHRAGP